MTFYQGETQMQAQMAENRERGYAKVKEGAAFLGLSVAKLYQLMSSGELPSVKLGKSRRIAWKEFRRRLATEAELRCWWEEHPTANVGIVLGRISGLLGIDIDGPEGEELLSEITPAALLSSQSFPTPRGGRRFLYALPAG